MRGSRKPLITSLSMVLEDARDFVVDLAFSQELPLQIRCKQCGYHLRLERRTYGTFYQHPKVDAGVCSATTAFTITPKVLLEECLAVVLAHAPSDPERTVYDRLYRWIRGVEVESTRERRGVYVHLHKEGELAA